MDPVADMLVTIKNGYMARKNHVVVPYSNFKFEIAKILEKEKFIDKIEKEDKTIKIVLAYDNKKPRITSIKKVSKLGLRIYIKSKNIGKIKGGRGMAIVSTSKGVMADRDARRQKLGGEVICKLW